MSDTNDQDKSHEASQKKLDDARKKGDIARSNEVNATAAFIAVIICWWSSGAWIIDTLGQPLALLMSPHRIAPWNNIDAALSSVALTFMLICLGPFCAIILIATVMKTWTFTPDKLAPKLERISIIQNAKQKFGPTGLAEFLKNLLKISTVLLVTIAVAFAYAHDAVTLVSIPLVLGIRTMLKDSLSLLMVTALVLGVFASIDIIWQKYKFSQKMRMSHQELRDEHKESEGDPYLKQARRQKGIEIASQSIVKDVQSADVIVVNPTHYAVALSWDRQSTTAPKCVAKGVDHMAQIIRKAAEENDIPIHPDPPTARAIYATTNIGDQIDPQHYAAVATAIRFADGLKSRK